MLRDYGVLQIWYIVYGVRDGMIGWNSARIESSVDNCEYFISHRALANFGACQPTAKPSFYCLFLSFALDFLWTAYACAVYTGPVPRTSYNAFAPQGVQKPRPMITKHWKTGAITSAVTMPKHLPKYSLSVQSKLMNVR